jgi:hypothetical protein
MTKQTRSVLFASVAILLVGFTAGGLAYYGYLGRFLQPSVPSDLRYVPRGVDILGYVDVRALMNSQFRRELGSVPGLESRRGQQEFRDGTGIDIEKDIDRVVVYLMPGAGGPEESPRGAVLARGRFDQKRIESLVREQNGTAEDYRGKRILLTPRRAPRGAGRNGLPDGPPVTAAAPGEMALAFIETGLVAMGSRPLVRGAIDLDQGGPNITGDDEFMKLIHDVDQGDAWAVGRLDMLTRRMKMPATVTEQVPPLRFFSATGHLDGGLTGRIQAEAADDAAGQQLRDVVRGFLALGKLQAGSRPEFQAMLNSLELGGTGRTVSLSFSVAPEALQAFGRSGGRRGGRAQ